MDLRQFILEQIHNNQFFQGAGLTAILLGLWQTVKSFGPRIWHFIAKRVSYEVLIDTSAPDDAMYHAVREWAIERKSAKRARWYTDNNGKLIREETEDWSWMWLRGRPLKISKEREKLEQAQYVDNRYENKYRFTYWFGKRALDELLQNAYDNYVARQKFEDGVPLWNAAPGSFDNFRKRLIKDIKPFSELFFVGKRELIADIEGYISSRDLYKAHGIRCKRGYLLSGPPGTGKTSSIIAAAKLTGRPIFMIPLSDVKTDNELIQLIADVPAESILAFEDIDALFVEREGATLSYSAFLNCIDGLNSPDDCLIFMTTNHKDRLDEALLRRGRMDYHLEIGYPTNIEIKAFLENFYGKYPDFEIESMPMTDVQDLVLRASTLEDWATLYHQ